MNFLLQICCWIASTSIMPLATNTALLDPNPLFFVMMEVCDNGLDDDGDGKIDMFDPDCQCTITPPPNLVPNGAFEETAGCCADLGVFNCLEDWIVLGPSPDYISDNCRSTNLRPDVRFLSDALNDGFNEGYAFSVLNTTDDRQFTESLGVCLTEPMEEGKTYEVSFDLANLRNDSPDIPFALLGIDRCDELNMYDTRGNNSYCEQGLPFTRLGTINAQELTEGWNTLTFEITPSENIEAILYSVDCAFNPNNQSATFYMVIDNVSIREKINTPSVPVSLSWLDTSICVGGAYTFGDQLLTMPGIYRDTLSSAWGCDSIVELNLGFLEGTTTSLFQEICYGDMVSFGGTSLSASGLYRDTLVNAQGCDSIITLELNVLEESVINLAVTVCVGETYFFGGEVLSATGVYEDTLSTIQGCDSVILLDLSVAPSVVGDTLVIHQPLGTEFYFAGNAYSSAGFYQTVLLGANGCDSTAYLSLSFFDPCETALQIDADLFDPTCEIAENGELELIGVGGFPPFQYAVGSGPFQFDPLFTGLRVGEYTVKVLDSFGCLATASFSLTATDSPVQVEAGPDTSVLLGNSVLLRLKDINFSASAYQWMLGQEEICTNCQEWLVRPTGTTVYTLQAMDEFGCIASDEVQVEVVLPPAFYIPNAFSPNDDGVNDFFRVESTPDGLSRIEGMMIYSRWGDLVYEAAAEADAQPPSWDGMVNGKRVEPGIYVYCIHWQKPDGEKALFSGDVLLIR